MIIRRRTSRKATRRHHPILAGTLTPLIAAAALGVGPAPTAATAAAVAEPGPTEHWTALGIYDNAEGEVRADWTGGVPAPGDVARFSICTHTKCVGGVERGLTWTPTAVGSLVLEPDQLPELSFRYPRMSVWISGRTASGGLTRISPVQTIRFVSTLTAIQR